MKKNTPHLSLILLFIVFGSIQFINAQSFTAGRLVVVQTTGSVSKGGSPVTLQEYSTSGTAGVSVSIPSTGTSPFQMAAGPGGSEGFLTKSTDNAFLMLAGYSTSTTGITDITTTASSTTPRVIFSVNASGSYAQVGSSTTNYNANDIRGAISDGFNYWASGASTATDGVDYYGPGTPVALGIGAKAYGLQIFNNQIYYSTQKAGPANTSSHLGVFSLGTGLPTSGTPSSTQIIDVGTATPTDFSFNAAGTVCYVAINLNTAVGGIQKWTKSGSTWSLAYTLGTGVVNIGAYSLVVDYSGANPIIYATTFESNTTGNRIIKITDTGSGSTATTLVTGAANTWFHGIAFAPSAACTAPAITSLTSNGSVCAGSALNFTLSATGSSTLTYAWTGPNGFTSNLQNPSIPAATVAATGTYSVTVSNGCGSASSTVSSTVYSIPTAIISAGGPTTFCSGNSVILSASAGTHAWSNGSTDSAITVNTTGNYSVTITNANGCSATSAPTSVTVNPTVTPGVSITTNTGSTICSGTNVVFTATPVNGGVTPSYQWTLNGTNTGTNSVTYSNNTFSDGDVVACVITSNANCASPVTATSNAITINVTMSVVPAVSIASGSGTTICNGANTIFTATPVNAGAAPSYQWKLNGSNVGSDSATYSNNTLLNGDVVSCVITSSNACSSPATATSNNLTITIITNPNQPAAFTTGPAAANAGQTGVTYTVPNDALATSYTWTYTGSGATINGTTNTITIDFSSSATAGTLSVTANNSCGSSIAETMNITINAPSFTAGRLVALQTTGSVSKASSAIVLKEITTSGIAGVSIALPVTGINPIQTSGVYGGSEGFLTTSTDGKFLVVGGYGTTSSFTDITGTSSASVPRVVGSVTPSGAYTQIASSNTYYSLNDIRGAVSDGTNYWASGASVASVDGINYFGPGTQSALATGVTPPKGYGIRIFGGEIYYSTQKAGPTNSATQLGIFKLSGGLPTSGAVTVSQIINTGSIVPEDFSFNAAADVCYVAVNLNTAAGGIQKWTKSGSTWSLAYTLGTGVTNIGAYGLVVDYSGTNPVLYATTFESTGNRIIKITDTGSGSIASTLVAATTGVFYKGITFAPVDSGAPTVNLSVSSTTASESSSTVVTVTATASSPVSGAQNVTLAVSGTGITSGDYTLSNTIITIPDGSTTGSITFTVTDDAIAESTEIATLTITSPSPGILIGTSASKTISITDNDSGTPPTIVMNISTTSDFIDGGIVTAPVTPYGLSGVIADPTDPAGTLGINFTVNDAETAASSLVVSAISSNTTVVPNANILVTGSAAIRNVKILPAAVGYSDITVTVSDGINTASYIINYAASDPSPNIIPANTFWHTGMSDGSDAIALDDNYYISGDDELDILNVYSRSASGLPLVSYNYSSHLALPDPAKPEVDVEAATKSTTVTNRMYWTGSMSNGKLPYDNKPNRDRLFATSVAGTGDSTSFSFVGYYNIRTALLAWGDANGYNFTASAAAGVDSKSPSGFSLEGMTFGPDNTTLFLGLRAPLVPTSLRTNAVIAPILNFETWFNNGAPTGDPIFGDPIELNLDNRGIRDITRLSNGTYIIIAGSPIEDGGVNDIYKWTGYASDAPVALNSPAGGILNMEGLMQMNDSSGHLSLSKLQIISDGGSMIPYQDSHEAKDFADLKLRKFRSDIVTGLDLDICSGFNATIATGGSTTLCSGDSVNLSAPAGVNNRYLWSTGAASQSIYVSAFQNYSVRVTSVTSGCSLLSPLVQVIDALPSDFNRDHLTNNIDFLLLLSKFNQSCTGCLEDIDKSGVVNNIDFLSFVGQFNQSCH